MRALRHFFLLLAPVALLSLSGCETLVSDAATRLAYDLRDHARRLRGSSETRLTFEYRMRAWPDGCSGDYRIRLFPTEGKRGVFVTCDPRKPDWYATNYHLNFIVVPADLSASHKAGEITRVTLEKQGDKILLTGLE